MKKTQGLSMNRKLYALIGVFVVGLVLFGTIAFKTVHDSKVNGVMYNKIVQDKNLIADILPPPAFIVRPYLNVWLMVNAETREDFQKALTLYRETRQDFEERHEFWAKELKDGAVKEELGENSKEPADEFFAVVDKEVIPALEKNDRAAAHKIVMTKLPPLYAEHRAAIDKLVKDVTHKNETVDEESDHEVARNIWEMILTGEVVAVVVVALGWWIRRSLVAQQLNDLDNTAQVAAISKAQAVVEFDMDGMVRTANENFLQTLGYTLDEIKGRHQSMFVDEAFRHSPEYKEFWSRLNRGEYQAAEYKRIGKGGKEVWIQASYNPIPDINGKMYKVVKYATDVTTVVKARHEMTRILELVKSSAETLGSSAEELTAVSAQMAANAEKTSAQANVVSAASEQVSKNVQTVSTGVEEMNSAIREIAKNATESARVAQQAVVTAETANTTISKLGESSAEIGNVIKIITSIAEQTNLLALNATIEAARAGEAGKGFAVVANEVKELAKETARATEDISRKIEAIQGDTRGAVDSIQQIGQVIVLINDISNTIASAVEEQTATATEMSHNVSEAAKGTAEIAQNITAVAQAAQNTTQGASNAQQAASELSRMATDLQKLGAGQQSSHSLAV